MKKIILLLIALITIAPSFAQDNMPQQWLMRARILQVDQSDVSAFEKAVGKKTTKRPHLNKLLYFGF